MTPAKKTTTSSTDVSEKKKEYKYQQEISQMVRTAKASPIPSQLFLAVFLADVRLWRDTRTTHRDSKSGREHHPESTYRAGMDPLRLLGLAADLAFYRSFRRVHSQIEGTRDTSLQKI
jgi:hypothetical protein